MDVGVDFEEYAVENILGVRNKEAKFDTLLFVRQQKQQRTSLRDDSSVLANRTVRRLRKT
jgi:hypothetical protein